MEWQTTLWVVRLILACIGGATAVWAIILAVRSERDWTRAAENMKECRRLFGELAETCKALEEAWREEDELAASETDDDGDNGDQEGNDGNDL